MKAKKTHKADADSVKTTAKAKNNPFTKLATDKKRIAEAIKEDVALSSLKDIKFVRPI